MGTPSILYICEYLIICSLSSSPLPDEDTNHVSFTHHPIHLRQAQHLTCEYSWMDSQVISPSLFCSLLVSFLIVLSPQLDCSHRRAETISHIPPKSLPMAFHSNQCQYLLIKLSRCKSEELGRQED